MTLKTPGRVFVVEGARVFVERAALRAEGVELADDEFAPVLLSSILTRTNSLGLVEEEA
jgi:hypothetical protein